MPLSDQDLHSAQRRVEHMLRDTVSSFQLIEKNADQLFGINASQIKAAINEYIEDFWENTNASGETHPEVLIYQATKENFQNVGFYGAQLTLKERQVQEVNKTIKKSLENPSRGLFRNPFRKWIDIINNFLSSLISATGTGEALKELKDCLRDELPDDEE